MMRASACVVFDFRVLTDYSDAQWCELAAGVLH